MPHIPYLINIGRRKYKPTTPQTKAIDYIIERILTDRHIPNHIYKVDVGNGGYVNVRNNASQQGMIRIQVQQRRRNGVWYDVDWFY